MIKAKDLLELADKQVGTMDKPIGSCNNKYNTAYYGGKVNNPALAWCVVFIWWLFRELGSSAQFCDGKKMASVPATYNWFKQSGQLVSKPEPGDIVFFDFNRNGTPDHIGVVAEPKSNGGCVSYEGNTSDASQANGGTVQKKTRTKAQIFAYARPKYAADTTSTSPKKSAKLAEKGFIGEVQKALGVKVTGKADKATLAATITISPYRNRAHAVVKVVQKQLVSLGYDVGKIDGIAGPRFTLAVRAFQRDHGCVADGVITARAKTWQELLK